MYNSTSARIIGKYSGLHQHKQYVPQNGVQKNYVPHVPQIGVQFGVQIRVHWEKSQNKALG